MSGLENRLKSCICYYDFAKEGGAVGDIALRGGALPSGAIVHSGLVTIQTAVTSGGSATVALKLESAGDVLAATAKASLISPGVAVVPVITDASKWILTTGAVQVVATVAVAALTAGKLIVELFYTLND